MATYKAGQFENDPEKAKISPKRQRSIPDAGLNSRRLFSSGGKTDPGSKLLDAPGMVATSSPPVMSFTVFLRTN